MRRFLQLSTLVPTLIIAAVFAMVGYANWRESKRSGLPQTPARLIGMAGGVRTSRQGLVQQVTTMKARLAKNPEDTGAAMVLADLLLRQARVAGNPGLALSAEEVLRRVLTGDPGNYDASRMLGALYLSEHRFREAVQIAEKNSQVRPYDSTNYGVMGDGHLELGEYDEAFDAFDRMMRLRPSAAAYARVAYARELRGDLNGAIEAMRLAAEATSAEDLEAQAWTHAQIGELLLQLGRTSEAKQEYATASQAFPGHPFAVVGYAKAIAAEGDVQGALTLLEGLAQQSPTPDLAARIGDLLERLGRHEDAERQYTLAETGWRVDAPDPKNLARFLAEHDRKIDEAVKLAEAVAVERKDIFTEDALAWAYFKAGRAEQAAAAIHLALRTGTRDRDILAHAAAIRRATPSTIASR